MKKPRNSTKHPYKPHPPKNGNATKPRSAASAKSSEGSLPNEISAFLIFPLALLITIYILPLVFNLTDWILTTPLFCSYTLRYSPKQLELLYEQVLGQTIAAVQTVLILLLTTAIRRLHKKDGKT